MAKRREFCVAQCALVLVVGLSLATSASGQTAWGYGGGFYPYSCYPCLPPIPLRADQSIPYHAVHPPVYYSHIVPRPYGYSPYAYVPGVVTPEFVLWGPRGQLGPAPGQDFERRSLVPAPEPGREEANRPNRQAASDAPPPAPVVIHNQYASGESATMALGQTLTRDAMRIENPYCEVSGSAGSGGLETTGDNLQVGPRIVFPVVAAEASQ